MEVSPGARRTSKARTGERVVEPGGSTGRNEWIQETLGRLKTVETTQVVAGKLNARDGGAGKVMGDSRCLARAPAGVGGTQLATEQKQPCDWAPY